MRVHVIDHNTQLFNGKVYTRFGRYFRRRTFLHRDVWEHHNGPIPERHHVHHVDHDGSNNQIENLIPVEAFKHISDHQRGHARRPIAALRAAAAWRQTEIGRKFHHEHGKRNATTCTGIARSFASNASAT
jgi:hypothetical protein